MYKHTTRPEVKKTSRFQFRFIERATSGQDGKVGYALLWLLGVPLPLLVIWYLLVGSN